MSEAPDNMCDYNSSVSTLERMPPKFLSTIPTNDSDIAQALLNIERKERSNLFAWNGQFSPQLVEVLLRKYARNDAAVLDPFAGSGTVLYECGRFNLRGISSEINPSAFAMMRLYQLINISKADREHYVEEVDEALAPILVSDLELLQSATSFPEVENQASPARLSGKLCGWPRSLLEALLILTDNGMKGLSELRAVWKKLKSIVLELPLSDAPLLALNCDARCLPIPDASVDLVLTSPPYINVFNYHQQYRSGAEALGWDLLKVAKSEIGSNRKHRGNRFLTVVQYCLDISAVLAELGRVCKPSARAIFVVGRESSVRGSRFYNGEIVARLAAECTGFALGFRQERVFTNRYGQAIVEDILHFGRKKTRKHCDLFNSPDALAIARSFLQNALADSPTAEVRADIEDALAKMYLVDPSPMFHSGTQGRHSASDGIPDTAPRQTKSSIGKRKVAQGRR